MHLPVGGPVQCSPPPMPMIHSHCVQYALVHFSSPISTTANYNGNRDSNCKATRTSDYILLQQRILRYIQPAPATTNQLFTC